MEEEPNDGDAAAVKEMQRQHDTQEYEGEDEEKEQVGAEGIKRNYFFCSGMTPSLLMYYIYDSSTFLFVIRVCSNIVYNFWVVLSGKSLTCTFNLNSPHGHK